MRNLFSRKIDDATKSKFIDIIAGMLKIQTFVAGRASLKMSKATLYMDFLVKNIASDALMNVGVMHGGQQFLDYMKPRASECLWGSPFS